MSTQSTATRDVPLALLGAGALSWVAIELSQWPPETSLILDGTLWLSLTSVIFSTAIAALLYCNKIGTARHSRAVFSLSLIVLSIGSFSLFQLAEKNTNFWAEHFNDRAADVAVVIDIFIQYSSNYLSLVLVAVGANLLASTFPSLAKQV